MPKKLPALWLFTLIPLLMALFASYSKTPFIYALTASHIVISEVQIGGGTTDDEFVELYNPTANNIDLTGFRLTRKTDTGTQSNLIASMSGTISSHGYYLIARPSTYDGSVTPDATYSNSSNALAPDNTVLLYSDAGVTVVDKVGMGTVIDTENTAIGNPATNGSVERKANSLADETSMTSGIDVTNGNGEDTNNNSLDFILRVTADPQNTSSTLEPASVGTPTPSPFVSLTGTPLNTPTSTNTPTQSPSPSVQASLTPTSPPISTPTGTAIPTSTLTPTSTPTATITPFVSLTPTPSPTPTGGQVITTFPFPGGIVVCTLNFRRVGPPFSPLYVPYIHCAHIHN